MGAIRSLSAVICSDFGLETMSGAIERDLDPDEIEQEEALAFGALELHHSR